jgi:hypothetical protein
MGVAALPEEAMGNDLVNVEFVEYRVCILDKKKKGIRKCWVCGWVCLEMGKRLNDIYLG